ncbi:uncharacterized protein B0T15DRAFT_72744 [Chaetomium strumarium]|uniref:Uncharacterized protein n=1 Tax=Chaetomium strumarium TaxID=1170767 RepID=A0AAJ0M755_9PEZI|nr:hypothetical protein B0T15DRAFT_72744 [Chaetomium strumarium]
MVGGVCITATGKLVSFSGWAAIDGYSRLGGFPWVSVGSLRAGSCCWAPCYPILACVLLTFPLPTKQAVICVTLRTRAGRCADALAGVGASMSSPLPPIPPRMRARGLVKGCIRILTDTAAHATGRSGVYMPLAVADSPTAAYFAASHPVTAATRCSMSRRSTLIVPNPPLFCMEDYSYICGETVLRTVYSLRVPYAGRYIGNGAPSSPDPRRALVADLPLPLQPKFNLVARII